MSLENPRTRSRRWALPVAAIAVVAVLVFLWSESDDARERRADREAETGAAADAGRRDDGTRKSRPESDPAEVSTVRRPLRVRVELTDGEAERVSVSVYAADRRDLAPVSTQGPIGVDFEIDVASLLPNPPPEALDVSADHPDYLPERKRVVPAISDSAPVGTVVLRLRRAAAVSGRVQGADGKPRANTFVSLFPMIEGGPADEAIAHARTDADGAYRMRAGAEGRHLLVVLEEDEIPAFAPVELWIGRETEAPPLVLVAGAEISGRVLVNGTAPDGQAIVRAVPSGGGHPFWYGNALWTGGRVHHGEALGFTTTDGGYRIGGLVAGPHRVRVSNLPAAHPDLARSRSDRESAAPAANVDFDFACAWLQLRIERLPDKERSPPTRYGLLVKGAETFSLSTPDPQPILLGVVPGADYRLELKIERRQPVTKTVRAPGAGETLTVDLAPGDALPRSALLVTLRASPATPPGRAGFALFAVDPAAGLLPILRHDAVGEAGRFLLKDLPVGRFRLVTRPGGKWFGPVNHWRAISTDVELRADSQGELALDVTRGGVLRLVARSGPGRILEARCRVADANGRELDVEFVSADGRESGTELLRGGAPSDVRPALPAGRYKITLDHDGFSTVTRTVNVREGERTEIEVTLPTAR